MAVAILEPITSMDSEIEVSIMKLDKYSIKRIELVVNINNKYYKLYKDLVLQNWKFHTFLINRFGKDIYNEICVSIDNRVFFTPHSTYS